MMNHIVKRFGAIFLSIAFATVLVIAQTGGPYEIEKSVTASGGNTSSGGTYSLQSTTGQSVSNASPQGGTYQILSGFWTPLFAPTAAAVTISGRVFHAKDSGIPSASVSYTDSLGNIKIARTNSFGFFRFDNAEAGQTYIFEVSAKGYLFAPQIINISEDISGLNFIPLGH